MRIISDLPINGLLYDLSRLSTMISLQIESHTKLQKLLVNNYDIFTESEYDSIYIKLLETIKDFKIFKRAIYILTKRMLKLDTWKKKNFYIDCFKLMRNYNNQRFKWFKVNEDIKNIFLCRRRKHYAIYQTGIEKQV